MDSILREQLKSFKNPEARPEECPKCGGNVTEHAFRDMFSSRSCHSGGSDEKKVACCAACVLLLWDIPTKMDDIVAKMHASLKDKNTPP